MTLPPLSLIAVRDSSHARSHLASRRGLGADATQRFNISSPKEIPGGGTEVRKAMLAVDLVHKRQRSLAQKELEAGLSASRATGAALQL